MRPLAAAFMATFFAGGVPICSRGADKLTYKTLPTTKAMASSALVPLATRKTKFSDFHIPVMFKTNPQSASSNMIDPRNQFTKMSNLFPAGQAVIALRIAGHVGDGFDINFTDFRRVVVGVTREGA